MKLMVISAITPEASATHALARMTAAACVERGATVDLVTPGDVGLPVNDGTLDWHDPRIERWRQRLAGADAHIWVSPEYHGALTASLKNLFDYLEKAPLQGEVVGMCALAGGAVAALNTLNGMSVIARSLGAWVVPNLCAFNSNEVKGGLDDRALGRLYTMCDTVLETAERLQGPAPAGPDEQIAITVATLEHAALVAPPPPPRAAAEPAAAEPATELSVPDVREAREVSRGIAGVRYEADYRGNRAVVRIVPAKLLGNDARDRFVRDQGAVRALPPHPNLGPIGDAGVTEEGDGYVVSRAGPSVTDMVAEHGPFEWRAVLDTGVRLAGVLETVHRSELVHRDVCPENVLFDPDGRPMLTDTAVAPTSVRALERQHPVALAHVAPERFRGEEPEAAADIYGLGSTLFTMLVGRAAFTDENDRKVASLIRRVALEPIPDLRTQMPEPLWLVVQRSMAKDPTERYGTAEELGRALQQAQMMVELPTATMTLFGPDAHSAAAPLAVSTPVDADAPADTETGAS